MFALYMYQFALYVLPYLPWQKWKCPKFYPICLKSKCNLKSQFKIGNLNSSKRYQILEWKELQGLIGFSLAKARPPKKELLTFSRRWPMSFVVTSVVHLNEKLNSSLILIVILKAPKICPKCPKLFFTHYLMESWSVILKEDGKRRFCPKEKTFALHWNVSPKFLHKNPQYPKVLHKNPQFWRNVT